MHLMNSSRAESTMNLYKKENQRRSKWLVDHQMSDGDSALVLYLASRAMTTGSSSLGIAAAAFQFAREKPSECASDFIKSIIAAKKRAEAVVRKPPAMVSPDDVERVWLLLDREPDAKMERDVLLVMLSWNALLRASEASELEWADISREQGLVKVVMFQGSENNRIFFFRRFELERRKMIS